MLHFDFKYACQLAMDNGIRYAQVRFRTASIKSPSYAWADPKTDEVIEEQFQILWNFGSVTAAAK